MQDSFKAHKMNIWGMSKNGHDWAICVYKNGVVIKTISGRGKQHTQQSVDEALSLANPDLVVWYENPYLKSLRQWWAGQPKPFARNNITKYLKQFGITCKWTHVGHHESHAAHYFNSGYKDATIIVLDSIGEFDCTSIWKAEGNNITKLISSKYPHSIGLFYSAMTQRVGLTPQQDEGKFDKWSNERNDYSRLNYIMEYEFIKQIYPLPKVKRNFHRGAMDWAQEYTNDEIATATSCLFERIISNVLLAAKNINPSENLVISGGVAFNSQMPRLVGKLYNSLYIPPNPSDTGSAEGAVLAYLNRGIV